MSTAKEFDKERERVLHIPMRPLRWDTASQALVVNLEELYAVRLAMPIGRTPLTQVCGSMSTFAI